MSVPPGETVSVYAHLTAIMNEQDRRNSQRFADLTENIKNALEVNEKTLTKVEKVSNQVELFVTRSEMEARLAIAVKMYQGHDTLLVDHGTRITSIEAKAAGFNALWLYLIGIVSLISTVLSIYNVVAQK